MKSRYEVVMIDEDLADQYNDKREDPSQMVGLYAVVDRIEEGYFQLFENESDATKRKSMLDDVTPVYLNAYFVQRLKGGNEEGGWWYDAGEPIESIRCKNWTEAESKFSTFEDKWNQINKEEGNRGLGSVLSMGEYQTCVEYRFASAYPVNRPRYE